MHSEEEDKLLRIFISEHDTYGHRPLFEVIINKAKELGLAGATAYRGIMGFGADKRMKSNNILELSADLPVVIEIIDAPEQLQRLMPFLDEAVQEGFVTVESVHVFKYRKQ